jgi:hypothetical protein
MVTAKNVIIKPATLSATDRGVMNEQEEHNAAASGPNPMKLSENKSPVKAMEKQKQTEKKEPKALMKKKE